jgi:hypothetical protein
LTPCNTPFEQWEKDEKRQIGDESQQTATTSCEGDNVGATPCLLGNWTEKTQHAGSKKFKKRSRIYDALTMKYLVQIAWGLGNQYLSSRLKKSVRDADASLGSAHNCIIVTPALEGRTVERESKSVIDDYDLAGKIHTAPYLYSLNKCREEAGDNLNSVSYKERFLKAMAEYETIGDEKKVEWELERHNIC